jgi:hypothetical protein
MLVHFRPLLAAVFLCAIGSTAAPAFAAPDAPDSNYCNLNASACQAIQNMLDDDNAKYGGASDAESFSGSIMEKQTFVQCIQNYQQASMGLAHLYFGAWKANVAHGMTVAAGKRAAVQQYITAGKTLYGHYTDCMARLNYMMK